MIGAGKPPWGAFGVRNIVFSLAFPLAFFRVMCCAPPVRFSARRASPRLAARRTSPRLASPSTHPNLLHSRASGASRCLKPIVRPCGQLCKLYGCAHTRPARSVVFLWLCPFVIVFKPPFGRLGYGHCGCTQERGEAAEARWGTRAAVSPLHALLADGTCVTASGQPCQHTPRACCITASTPHEPAVSLPAHPTSLLYHCQCPLQCAAFL